MLPIEEYLEFRTDLGRIYMAALDLKQHKRGPVGNFNSHGKLALMYLQHYSQLSDRKLIEHLNGNLHWQLSCGIQIPPDAPIRDFKVVSKIRCELAVLLGGARIIIAPQW